ISSGYPKAQPAPGSIFNINSIGEGAFTGDLFVNWTADPGSLVTGYKVFYDTDTIDEMKSFFQNVSGTETLNATISGLNYELYYQVKVVSINQSDIKLNESSIVQGYPKAAPAPGSVFNILSVGPGSIVGDLDVSWTKDEGSLVHGYKVFFDTDTIDEMKSCYQNVSGTQTLNATITGLIPELYYNVKVVSLNQMSIKLNESEIYGGYPRINSGVGGSFNMLSATKVSSTEIRVEWTSWSDTNINPAYILEVAQNPSFNGFWVTNSYIMDTCFTITSLSDADTYYFRARATDCCNILGVTSNYVSEYVEGDANSGMFNIETINSPASGEVFIQWTNHPLYPNLVYAYKIEYSDDANFQNPKTAIPSGGDTFYKIIWIQNSG
ncbi:MAG TPA: fibronectin type III domain-containing protein, partial [bacterium]|nr:fibronectin type III domain-containing protein [bacterium]